MRSDSNRHSDSGSRALSQEHPEARSAAVRPGSPPGTSSPAHAGPTPSSGAGARESFEELFRTWAPVVKAAARPYLLCDSDAEDAMQSVFARLWANGSWRKIDSPEAFFRNAGAREGITRWRRRRRVASLTPPRIASLPSRRPRPDHELSARESRAASLRLIRQLPHRCRLVMWLVVIRGLTRSEAAERLGIGIGAVEKQITRGYRLLSEMSHQPDAQILMSTFVDGGGRTLDASIT